jgi:bifunctional UDP-N-acetylglucosamine pyrophosphorylase/glucosamine-1-phosphate N-acetyltransferase
VARGRQRNIAGYIARKRPQSKAAKAAERAAARATKGEGEDDAQVG